MKSSPSILHLLKYSSGKVTSWSCKCSILLGLFLCVKNDGSKKIWWVFVSSPLCFITMVGGDSSPTSNNLVVVFPHLCHTSSYILLVFPHLPMKSFQYWEKSLYSKVHHMVSQVSEFWIFINQTKSKFGQTNKQNAPAAQRHVLLSF